MSSLLKLRTIGAADGFKGKTGITTRTSYAAWWLKSPTKIWPDKQLKSQRHERKQSFGQDMGDLLQNVSLHGYNKLLDLELTLFEKLIWLSLHVASMVTLCCVLFYTWEHFVAQYFVINLHDPLYPVEKVPFPAVAICSNNRISYHAALEYAKELRNKDPKRHDIEYFMGHIRDFSRIYYRYLSFNERGEEYVEQTDDKFIEFQTFLEEHDIPGNESFYDTRKIMKRLTPKCSDLIMQCLLAGIEIDCFSAVAFEESLTTYGPCCTFNAHNNYQSRSSQNSYVLSDLGLTVILNTSKSDDFSKLLNNDGYAVLIYNSDNYPDVASGGCQEVFPTIGEEAFVSIKSRIVDTEDRLRSYSPISRKCYFSDEAPPPKVLRDIHSFSNCITQCRIRSIRALCNCMPFYLPLNLMENTQDLIYCTTPDIKCLLRYTFKWRNVLTQRQMLPELKRENEESLYCPNCLPSCYDVQYQVSLMSLPLDRFRASTIYDRLQSKGFDTENISVLRVHFKDPHSLYYRRVIGNAWFEVMSTIGNILSIFLGFSMLAVFEVLFFFLKYVLIAAKKFISHNTRRDRRRKKKNRNDISENKFYIYP